MRKIFILFLFVFTFASILSAAHTDVVSHYSSSQSLSQAPMSVPDLGLLFDKNVTKEFCEKYGVLQSVAPNAVARARYAARPGQRAGIPAAVKNWEYLPKIWKPRPTRELCRILNVLLLQNISRST